MFNTIARVACMLIFLINFKTGFASHWTYDEAKWPLQCHEGTKQSPISLSKDISEEQEFSSLIFEEYDVTYPALSQNNGHSVEIKVHVENKPTVRGGGLPYVYALDHLHFHWQSEHVIDDVRFPLELHLVHYAQRYSNVPEALQHVGGVTVFSVLFYLSPDDDAIFTPLISVIDKVQDQVNKIQEMHVKVEDFLPRDRAGFYRYNGSLTTPNCTEGLIWTVFTNKLPISRDQVEAFHQIKSGENEELANNYRSLQKLNGRRVFLRTSPIDNSGIISEFNVILKVLFLLRFCIELIKYL